MSSDEKKSEKENIGVIVANKVPDSRLKVHIGNRDGIKSEQVIYYAPTGESSWNKTIRHLKHMFDPSLSGASPPKDGDGFEEGQRNIRTTQDISRLYDIYLQKIKEMNERENTINMEKGLAEDIGAGAPGKIKKASSSVADDYEVKLNEIRGEKQKLKNQIKKLKQQLAQLNAEKDKEIEELKKKIKSLTDKNMLIIQFLKKITTEEWQKNYQCEKPSDDSIEEDPHKVLFHLLDCMKTKILSCMTIEEQFEEFKKGAGTLASNVTQNPTINIYNSGEGKDGGIDMEELNRLMDENNDLNRELERTRNLYDDCERRLQQIRLDNQESIRTLQNRIDRLQYEISRIEIDRTQIIEQFEKYRDEESSKSDNDRERYERAISEKNRQIRDLRRQIEEITRRIGEEKAEREGARDDEEERLRNAMAEMGRRILDEVNRKMTEQTTVIIDSYERQLGQLLELRRELLERDDIASQQIVELTRTINQLFTTLNELLRNVDSRMNEYNRILTEKIGTAESKLETIRREHGSKEAELTQLRSQLDSFQSDNDSKQREITALRSQIDELQRQLIVIERQKSDCEGELTRLREQLNELIRLIDAGNKERMDNNIQLEQLERQISELTTERETLIERIRELGNTNDSVVGRVGELESEKSEQIEKNRLLQIEIGRLNKQIEELQGRLSRLESENTTLHNENTGKDTTIDTLRQENLSQMDRIRQLEQDNSELSKQLEQMRNSETSKDVDNSRLTERLEEIKRMYRDLQRQLKESEVSREQQLDEIDRLKRLGQDNESKYNVSMKEKQRELEGIRYNLDYIITYLSDRSITITMDGESDPIGDLQQNYQNLQDELLRLRQELDSVREQGKQQDKDADARIRTIEGLLADCESKRTQLLEKIESLEKEKEELEQSNSELSDRLTIERGEIREERESMERRDAERNSYLSEMESSFDIDRRQKKRELMELQDKIKNLTDENSRKDQIIEELRDQITRLESDLLERDRRIDELQARNQRLQTELDQCHELIEKLRIQIAELAAQVEEMQGRAARGEYNSGNTGEGAEKVVEKSKRFKSAQEMGVRNYSIFDKKLFQRSLYDDEMSILEAFKYVYIVGGEREYTMFQLLEQKDILGPNTVRGARERPAFSNKRLVTLGLVCNFILHHSGGREKLLETNNNFTVLHAIRIFLWFSVFYSGQSVEDSWKIVENGFTVMENDMTLHIRFWDVIQSWIKRLTRPRYWPMNAIITESGNKTLREEEEIFRLDLHDFINFIRLTETPRVKVGGKQNNKSIKKRRKRKRNKTLKTPK